MIRRTRIDLQIGEMGGSQVCRPVQTVAFGIMAPSIAGELAGCSSVLMGRLSLAVDMISLGEVVELDAFSRLLVFWLEKMFLGER